MKLREVLPWILREKKLSNWIQLNLYSVGKLSKKQTFWEPGPP